MPSRGWPRGIEYIRRTNVALNPPNDDDRETAKMTVVGGTIPDLVERALDADRSRDDMNTDIMVLLCTMY